LGLLDLQDEAQLEWAFNAQSETHLLTTFSDLDRPPVVTAVTINYFDLKNPV